MERITDKVAKGFIPLRENYGNTDLEYAKYFTLSPSAKGEGWEDITYYTDKKYGLYADKGNGDQWVYILSNPTQPGLLKIGYTKKLPEERAKQISSATGVALPYKVEWAYQCFNGEMVEREVHHKLKAQRINSSKEFFQISLEEAKETINLIGNKFK
ncbi:GIY-YIG nuclease family protein [bacterium]|nr:GIY-YIG nuclease family protein [bacterium]|tara:strand:- start:143 stop:613 length:471 start_codon:yes stop_codon:yes gene_type:complete